MLKKEQGKIGLRVKCIYPGHSWNGKIGTIVSLRRDFFDVKTDDGSGPMRWTFDDHSYSQPAFEIYIPDDLS